MWLFVFVDDATSDMPYPMWNDHEATGLGLSPNSNRHLCSHFLASDNLIHHFCVWNGEYKNGTVE
jgi:hypothetical protein